MAGRLVTRLAGTGIKLMGSVLKGAGSLVQKAGASAPRTSKDGSGGSDEQSSRRSGDGRPPG